MAIPVWVPGQVLTAADINNWMVPNAVVKPSGQNVTLSTTLVNDTALVLPIVANASYIFECFLNYEGAARGTSDLKFNWLLPAGATLGFLVNAVGPAGGNFLGQAFNTAPGSLGSNGAGVLCGAQFYGTLTTVATAGNVQFQWAQNTSNGTATIVHGGSSLTLQRTS